MHTILILLWKQVARERAQDPLKRLLAGEGIAHFARPTGTSGANTDAIGGSPWKLGILSLTGRPLKFLDPGTSCGVQLSVTARSHESCILTCQFRALE
jgi:hypothetical protein